MAIKEVKICPKCRIEKPLNDFWQHKTGKMQGKFYCYCKKCCSQIHKSWCKKNKEGIAKRGKERYLKKSEAIRAKTKEYYFTRKKNEPWWPYWLGMNMRCRSEHKNSYPYYKAKGISVQMTLDDVKKLWFRNKAYLLTHPSIDRFNSDKNYTLENCRFIESRENSRKSGYQTYKNWLIKTQPK